MSLKAAIGPELPFLRRYARLLTGSQDMGDAAVRQMFKALLNSPDEFDAEMPERVELYRIFHNLWQSDNAEALTEHNAGDGFIATLPMQNRQALLLTAVEGFSKQEAAIILGSNVAAISNDISTARQSITDGLHASVLIIEDEAIIALHISYASM